MRIEKDMWGRLGLENDRYDLYLNFTLEERGKVDSYEEIKLFLNEFNLYNQIGEKETSIFA